MTQDNNKGLCLDHAQRLTAVEIGLANTNQLVGTVDKKLDDVMGVLSKQKGFIAGVGFALTSMAAVVAAVVSKLWEGR